MMTKKITHSHTAKLAVSQNTTKKRTTHTVNVTLCVTHTHARTHTYTDTVSHTHTHTHTAALSPSVKANTDTLLKSQRYCHNSHGQ